MAQITEHDALLSAIYQARKSPCAKSKRGVAIWHRTNGIIGVGHNSMPGGLVCNGSEFCRKHCGIRAVHAEQAALLDTTLSKIDAELIHVKVDDAGKPVASKEPCCWQCSKLILVSGIARVWLLTDIVNGQLMLTSWTAQQFHDQTLVNCGLEVPCGVQ